MRHLSLAEVLALHQRLLRRSGGATGIRDIGALESAVAQPLASFGDQDLYPSLIEKAAALAFSLIKNHAFVDGNKRLSHAAMEVLLLLNGHEVECGVDEQAPTNTERSTWTLVAKHGEQAELERDGRQT